MGTQGRSILLAEAVQLSNELSEFIPKIALGTKVTVAGSIRRKRPIVNDIDLIVITPLGYLPLELEHCFTFITKGNRQATFMYGGVQVDIAACKPSEEASFLLHWTGSKWHNIKMRKKANEINCVLSQYGLKINNVICHFGTEEDIFRALGMEYKLPEQR